MAGDGPTRVLMRKQAQRDPQTLQAQEDASRPEPEHRSADMTTHASASLAHRLAILGTLEHLQSETSRSPLKRLKFQGNGSLPTKGWERPVLGGTSEVRMRTHGEAGEASSVLTYKTRLQTSSLRQRRQLRPEERRETTGRA